MTRRLVVCLLAAVLAFASNALAKNGAFASTAHGNEVTGAQRLSDEPPGSCLQCHQQHCSYEPGAPDLEKGLFAPNDNNFCFVCHTAASVRGVFPGASPWTQSTHAESASMYAPDRSPADAGKCINCHDPHGVRDRDGVIPAMLTARNSELCLSCHDGSRGADIRTQTLRGYAHGDRARGQHDPREGEDPAAYASMPFNNRHVVCADCHNAHLGLTDPAPSPSSEASSRLAGVSRVEVVGGGAGVIPIYQWHAADDPAPSRDYEICFKCHSSWTTQPAGQTDIARMTNPANPSFHPIQAEGRNPNIDPLSFVNGFNAQTRVGCVDCHASDDPNVRGPHGSSYPYLLKKPITSDTSIDAMTRGDLCFDCHSYDVYGDPLAPPEVQRASRFNGPSVQGHAFHVGVQHVPCATCHDTHGSSRYPALIANRSLRGITTYLQTPLGGSCGSTCHAFQTYSVNYPR